LGQKVHPIGFRLGIIKTWDSRWFAGKKELPQLIKEDFTLRKYIRNRLRHAAVSKIVIERTPNRATIDIYTARPGVVIGRRGVEVDRLKEELQYLTGKEIVLNVHEIRRPELDALLVAENIARQLEGRVSFRSTPKPSSAASDVYKRQKIRCSGRLGGAEIARSHEEKEGRVPLHTLRADIDFARATAYTIYGTIGVKVWIFKGEVLEPQDVGR